MKQMAKSKFLTLLLSESDDWVLARCPEFKLGSFAECLDEAKAQLFEDIRIKSSVIVSRKEQNKEEVDDDLYSYASIINNNGCYLENYIKKEEFI